MLAYPPALWTSDSLRYVTLATQLKAYQIQPVGYPFALMLMRPFHSLTLVVGIQHAMGLATGTLVYALLRRRFRLPTWAAALAAVPALLSAYAIQLEHFLLSDTLFGLLVTIVIVLVLWRPVQSIWVCAAVGLLLAAAATVRSQGFLLAIPIGAYLLMRFATRHALKRAVASILVLGFSLGIPLFCYASWFDSENGAFQITSSTGAYLYSRVTTFADCSVIKPPAKERFLCLSTPVADRQYPGYYVWATDSPLAHGPGWEFDNATNSLATSFALRAIEAQPLAYLGAVWHTTFESFRPHRDNTASGQSQSWYEFSGSTPQSVPSLAAATDYSDQAIYAYNHGDPSTRMVQPYAGWIRAYQRFVVVPGPLLGVIVIIGLLGIAMAWRRFGGVGALAWLTGAALIVTPAATADFDARYLVASIPVFCIAAGISFREVRDYFRRQHGYWEDPGSDLAATGEIYLR